MFQPISGGEGGSSEVEASEQRPERSSSSSSIACGTLCGGGCSRRSSKHKGPEAEAWQVARWQENGERTRMEGQQGPRQRLPCKEFGVCATGGAGPGGSDDLICAFKKCLWL